MSTLLIFLSVPFIALGAHAIMTAWFKGSIFEKWREYFNNRPGMISELLGCELCFSYHAVYWPACFALLGLSTSLKQWWLLPVVWFASVELLHFATDVAHDGEEDCDDTGTGEESSSTD